MKKRYPISEGLKVFVYYNLHQHLFSIQALEGPYKGKVVAYSDKLFLKNATFRVSEAGRKRVIKENRKNVHAGVVGEMLSPDSVQMETFPHNELTYNPYKTETFICKTSLEPVYHAPYVWLKDKKVYI